MGSSVKVNRKRTPFRSGVYVLSCVSGSPCLFAIVVWATMSLGLAQVPPSTTAAPPQQQSGAKSQSDKQAGPTQSYPELVDITASTGIHFEHLSSPEQKFIVESMSAGVALIDYDRDGWPDIYFTNAQTVETALKD